ncbi:MAG TPA: nucleoside-diphosphate kinase [Acidobacteriota bacterium]|nr:nucleoside-diphosphate kinase [Acidobacteriota bacterium]
MIERTLVLLKPDAVARQLNGQIITRFETAGLKIVGLKMVHVDKNFAKTHYREDDIAKRRGYDVWEQNLEFLSKGPVVALVLEGINAIANVRKIVGSTEPSAAAPGTIRGDFCHATFAPANANKRAVANVIHASSSVDDAKVEISVWFKPSEIHSYKTVHEHYMHHTF